MSHCSSSKETGSTEAPAVGCKADGRKDVIDVLHEEALVCSERRAWVDADEGTRERQPKTSSE